MIQLIKILLQDFDNTYHNKIVLPNGEVLNSNYGLENCIIFNVNETNFTGKAKILGTLAIYLIINKSNDPNKKIPFFTDMNKENYGTYFRSFSNLDVNNNPFGCIFYKLSFYQHRIVNQKSLVLNISLKVLYHMNHVITMMMYQVMYIQVKPIQIQQIKICICIRMTLMRNLKLYLKY